MANSIILKKSSVASKIPLASDLAFGEIALNYADGKIYYKKSDGVTIDSFQSGVSSIPSVSGNSGKYLTTDGTTVSWGTITIGSGALSLTASAGVTNTSVSIGTGTGFTANSTGASTYNITIGPALINLATLMTSGSTGFIKRTGQDTYSIDTNTYLTAEADTLATVTARGASTSTITTFSGGDGNNSSVKLAGYNQRGGVGYHGFLEATNTLGTATNPSKYFRINSTGSLEIVNNAYTLTILSLSDAGALSVPSTISASNFSGSSSGTNTGDQTITLTGDVTGSGTGSFATTLANSGVTAGTYTKVTVDAKGRVITGASLVAGDIPALSYAPTAGSTSITTLGTVTTGTWNAGVISSTYGGTGVNNGGRTLTLNTNSGTLTYTNAATTLTVANNASVSGTNTGDQTITLTGDVTGSGTGSFATTLANSGVTAGTYTKVTVDAKGRVTTGASLATADLPTTLQTNTYGPGLTGSTSNAVAAAGTTQGTATALTSDVNIVTSSTAGTALGVVMMGATSGKYAVVVNRSANAINLYPASGHSFDGLAVNTPISIPVNGFIEMFGSSTTQWHTTYQAIVQGSFVVGNITGSAGSVANSLLAGSGLSGSSYNGSASQTWTLATAYGDTINPYGSKTANWVLAAPNGAAGVPTFRALVAADIPTLNQNTTGTASNVTGTVAIANGGTGQTTQQAALNALAGATTAAQFLRGNGTNVVMSAIQASDVPTLNQNTTGTAAGLSGTQTANFVYAAPNGTAGTASFRALVAADIPTLNQNTTGTASNVTGTVAIANGGTGATTAAAARTNLGLTSVATTGFTAGGSAGVPLIGSDGVMEISRYIDFHAAGGDAVDYVNRLESVSSGTLAMNGNTILNSANFTNYVQYLGTAAVKAIQYNSNTISENITIAANTNGLSAGPITISTGFTVTISTGATWTIV